MTTPRRTGRTPSALPAAGDPQLVVERLRGAVLGGRGPGAGTSEVLEHTRARWAVGGLAVPALREAVARDAAAARRDPDLLGLEVAAARRRLVADLDVLVPRLRPQRLLAARRGRRSGGRRRLRVILALLAGLLLVRQVARTRHGR